MTVFLDDGLVALWVTDRTPRTFDAVGAQRQLLSSSDGVGRADVVGLSVANAQTAFTGLAVAPWTREAADGKHKLSYDVGEAITGPVGLVDGENYHYAEFDTGGWAIGRVSGGSDTVLVHSRLRRKCARRVKDGVLVQFAPSANC